MFPPTLAKNKQKKKKAWKGTSEPMLEQKIMFKRIRVKLSYSLNVFNENPPKPVSLLEKYILGREE